MTLRLLGSSGVGTVLVAALLVVPLGVASAQATIEGRVLEAGTERPLSGAQVVNTTTGLTATTDDDGRYQFRGVAEGSVGLRARLIGFAAATQTVAVPAVGTVTVDFRLQRSAIQLTELVVTGQGREVEQRELATPVGVIGADEIQRAAVTSIDQLLQGRTTGASISSVSAQAGTGSRIDFRGVTSAFASQTPVVYYDGIRVDNEDNIGVGTGGEFSSALAELPTTGLERIETTTGGAASTLYGADAASGVIQIFSSKGHAGPPRFTLRVEQGIDTPELKYMLDVDDIFPTEVQEGRAEPDFMARHYWRTGGFQNYYLGVSGGATGLTYSLGGRVQQADGVQPKNTSELFNLRGGMRALLSERVSVEFSGTYIRNNFGRLFNGTAIADPLTTFEVGDALFFSGAATLQEALRIFLMPNINEGVNRFIFSAGAQYRVSDAFGARFTVGVDNRTNQQRVFEPIGFTAGEASGELTRFDREFTGASVNFAGHLNWPRASNVTSDLTFGFEGYRSDESIVIATGTSFALPGSPDVDNAAILDVQEANTEQFTGGFFLQEQVGVAGRLYLNGGVRVDASTTFGDEVGFLAFPKVGAAYVLSDEPFFAERFGRAVDALKLRVAYGRTGKQPQPFLQDRSYDAISFRGESAPRFDNPGNADLKSEITSTLEAGFDVALFDQRLGVGFTWFQARTRDALLEVPNQPATGLGEQLVNIGEIRNTGVELEARVQLVNQPDVQWSLATNFLAVKNEVTDLGGQSDFVTGQQRVIQGRPVGAWFVTTPFDSNGDGLLDDWEADYTGGQPTPTRSGSVRTDLNLLNRLSVSILADWATGHQVMDWGSVWATFNGIYRREIAEDGYRWPVQYNLAGDSIGVFSESQARSEMIYDGDYWKLREIVVRYELPRGLADRLGANNATVYGSVRNVAIFSKNKVVDPELAGLHSGLDLTLGGETSITASPPRQFRLGVQVVF